MRFLVLAFLCLASPVAGADRIDLGNRRELFADRFLIDRLDGCEHRLHSPHPTGTVLRFNAPWEGAFTGYATVIQVEVQDAEGQPIPGYTRADAIEQAGDEVDRVVAWKAGSPVASLAGREIRLHFSMKDADLYAVQFRR